MHTITLRVPDDLRALIAEAAEANGQSQSDYMRQAIEVHVKRVDPRNDRQPAEKNITLTPYERASLALQHQAVLAAQGHLPEESHGTKWHERAIEVLERGYEGEYPQLFPGDTETLNAYDCELVWDILDMFRVIHFSVEALGENGWAAIGIENAEWLGKFKGFDYQRERESQMASYTEYLVRSGRWTEQEQLVKKGMNSHMQMLPTYQSMLGVFKPLWRETARGGGRSRLNTQDLRKILLADPGAQDGEAHDQP
ncbi:YfbU family protein [Corynebacterium phoceense]|uniref:YfbU family protein n=1 Tax=Corynebacterium phoceense TaxID=1686286 RepID=UPI00211CEC96|nr:YfbU family protein [Corynebacterium phoceense]MCQ9334365.1 YfbU family protein [Corynebacterium phoceense]MCQ9337417.1 YfbU family protein [Corynebacterium phoceense]